MTEPTKRCEACGQPLSGTLSPCAPCRLVGLPSELSSRLDVAIVTQHPLMAIMYMQSHFAGLGMPGALEVVSVRYAQLRQARPGDFSCTHEHYWEGFDS